MENSFLLSKVTDVTFPGGIFCVYRNEIYNQYILASYFLREFRIMRYKKIKKLNLIPNTSISINTPHVYDDRIFLTLFICTNACHKMIRCIINLFIKNHKKIQISKIAFVLYSKTGNKTIKF